MRVFINICSDTGIHPELIHLDEELSKRRDKRLELASRHRTYEVSDAANRKRGLELVEGIPVARKSGIRYCHVFQYERDELQAGELSEMDRKRRRLEIGTRT